MYTCVVPNVYVTVYYEGLYNVAIGAFEAVLALQSYTLNLTCINPVNISIL